MKEKYFKSYPGTQSIKKFSYFLELYKKPKLREWIETSPSALDDFVDWVGEEKLARGEDVRKLVHIVSSPEATDTLQEKGYQAAVEVLEAENPEFSSKLLKLMKDSNRRTCGPNP